MSKIQYDVVLIHMNELHSQRRTVPTWETPVLMAVHSSTSVAVESSEDLDVPVPSAEAEYVRLETRYGADREAGGVPYVSQVYGQHGVGLARLADAIKDATATQKAAAQKATHKDLV